MSKGRAWGRVAMPDAHDRCIMLALCGDLMTGRGIDQLLPDPCPPILYESCARSAEDYVELAEESCGRIARPVSLAYPWGDALSELDAVKPDARIVNLETALTRSDEAWPGKGIHYRMSPENARMLAVAGIDCCTLANDHVLDWGFEVSREQRAFARGLVETADVDVVHGHSSHHVKGIEVHKGRPILYGCGDFLNDYEGIHGHEVFRGDLGLLYFVTLDPARGGLARLLVTPTRIERFQVRRALAEDARWLADTLNREGCPIATSVVPAGEGRLELQWS